MYFSSPKSPTYTTLNSLRVIIDHVTSSNVITPLHCDVQFLKFPARNVVERECSPAPVTCWTIIKQNHLWRYVRKHHFSHFKIMTSNSIQYTAKVLPWAVLISMITGKPAFHKETKAKCVQHKHSSARQRLAWHEHSICVKPF